MKDGAHIRLRIGDRLLAERVIFCSSSGSRREGLLGLSELKPAEGILMQMPRSRQGKRGLVTSIHMIGMKFPICVAWLDEHGRVVHSTVARPWGLYYGSPEPAWFVLEAHPSLGGELQNGVLVEWEQVEES
ncbi:MAG: DUF192 domain-containing protein [Chloroflexi bacterium]|nr:DUF192 domain-containing protein [Chloroflexota bacterium]